MPTYIIAICDHCGKEHKNRYNEYKKHKNHFCSKRCGYDFVATSERNVKERIEKNVFYSPDGCHYWIGTDNGKSGRPIMGVKGKVVGASRVVYQVYKGEIPDGFIVCHTCDNGLCVNPDHLFVGTYSDNTQDMLKKGRGNFAKGESSGKSKLTNNQVIAIRSLKGQLSLRQIGLRFNITPENVWSILRRDTWKHI